MEKLFVRILNVTLLSCALVSLLVVTGAVVFLVIGLRPAFFFDASSHPIKITYQPASIVSAEGEGSSGGTAQGAAPTSELSASAQASCNATDELYKFISNGQYGLADSDKCPDAQIDSVTSTWGDRTENYFMERAAYIKALLADDQAHAMFDMPKDSDVSTMSDKYMSDVNSAFDEKFRAEATVDDARKAREIMASSEAKAGMLLCAGIAATAFFSFLIVAFLLVAVRLEKHLGAISDKMPIEPKSA